MDILDYCRLLDGPAVVIVCALFINLIGRICKDGNFQARWAD